MPKPIRPIRIEGNIAYVPLSRGFEAKIDALDAEIIGRWNWCVSVRPRGLYAVRTIQPKGGRRQTILMHREIIGDDCGPCVDHINHDGLDNRRCNLRSATHSENSRNRKRMSNNKSGYKGVFWEEKRRKWCAQIRLHGKTKRIGRFSSAEEAHAAYCKAAYEIHGEYARFE